MGICDPTGTLKEREIFIHHNMGKKETVRYNKYDILDNMQTYMLWALIEYLTMTQ